MKNIFRVSSFLEKFHNTEIRVFAQFQIFPSCFDPVVLASYFPRKLRDEETSVFKNVELLKCHASKTVMLPKRPSDQSKTSYNYGRAAYSTHSSLAINSSTTSFFEFCRSIFTARGSTTKLMFYQSSLFFESCQ
ncbi:hypothetical protein IGI04_015744, partial [Brassica rapa subsp. trilocularis]